MYRHLSDEVEMISEQKRNHFWLMKNCVALSIKYRLSMSDHDINETETSKHPIT
jgi:hypothetical protein